VSPARLRAHGTAFGAVIGCAGVALVTVAMLPLRDDLSNVVVALLLVFPVLAGAFRGGRVAGVLTAVIATLLFDVLFTHPYGSFRFATRDDAATALALLALAVLASEWASRLREASRDARLQRTAFERLCRIVDLTARESDVEDVVSSARAEIIGLFDLDDCLFEPAPSANGSRRVDFDAALALATPDAGGEIVIPPGGVALAVRGRGRRYGCLVLYARQPVRATRLEGRVAVSIAEELALALSMASRID